MKSGRSSTSAIRSFNGRPLSWLPQGLLARRHMAAAPLQLGNIQSHLAPRLGIAEAPGIGRCRQLSSHSRASHLCRIAWCGDLVCQPVPPTALRLGSAPGQHVNPRPWLPIERGAVPSAARRHHGDVDRRAQLGTDLQHLVDVAVHELVERRLIADALLVDRQGLPAAGDVIERAAHLRAPTGRWSTIVDHHVGHALVVPCRG